MRYERLLVLACLGVATVSCSTLSWCGHKPPTNVVQVRWPVSAPTELKPADAGSPRPISEELLGHDRPGVQAREGRAHDIEFLEVVLGEARFDDALPLVVLIHGRGDRPRVPGGPFGGVPTAMRVVLPRGPRALGEGFSWLPVSITHGKLDVLTKALEARAQHLAAFIDWVKTNRPTLGRPIVSGFSQGGMLSFALASLRPDVVAAAFPLAGWLPPALLPATTPTPLHQVRIRAAHGDADPIIPVDPTRHVVRMFQTLGWDATLDVFDGVAHVVDKRMNAAFENWLEAALRDQAPALQGGLGTEGPEPEGYEDVEPLEAATIEAMAEEEEAAAAQREASDAQPVDSAGDGQPTEPSQDGANNGAESGTEDLAPATP